MDYKANYQLWSTHPQLDEHTRAELSSLTEKECEERFYRDLAFGTAGLRGIIGAGTNRMNYYTVAKAAEGYAQFFLAQGEDFCRRGLAISYDSRHLSPEFAQLTARVFVGHGIAVYVSDELRPVPMLSYAVRHYGCAGGVMITASHNPKQYNGFKAYGEDGGQLAPQAADRVAAYMAQVDDPIALYGKVISLEQARANSLWHDLSSDFDMAFNSMLRGLSINPEIVKQQKDLKIVYTPIHGSGNKPVRRILETLGFENVSIVKEQEEPDSEFTTAPYPNPETREALKLGLELMEETGADLLIATDPDADRTGVAVRDNQGELQVLSGNQIGILLMEYILEAKQRRCELPEKSFCVTTVVSSRLPQLIADHYHVDLTRVLTGFKYIGEQIKERDEQGDEHFQFGYEESFGYLAGTEVRDKDAVVSCMLIAEMAAVAASEGQTLYDRLQSIYRKYGYACEKTLAIAREGKTGQEQIADFMQYLRENQETVFSDLGVQSVTDYLIGEYHDLGTGNKTGVDLPSSNVLIFNLTGIDWLCARPSGTEPKVKIYFGFYAARAEEAAAKLQSAERLLAEIIERQL